MPYSYRYYTHTNNIRFSDSCYAINIYFIFFWLVTIRLLSLTFLCFIPMQRGWVSFLTNFGFLFVLAIPSIMTDRNSTKTTITQFVMNNHLLLFCKSNYKNESQSSRSWFLSHREHFTTFPFFVAKLSYFFFLSCFFSEVWTYSSTASFEKIGSLTKVVSSCTKLAKSDKHGSLPKLLLTTCTFLFHLSLRLPGNFQTRMQSVSGVSRAF